MTFLLCLAVLRVDQRRFTPVGVHGARVSIMVAFC